MKRFSALTICALSSLALGACVTNGTTAVRSGTNNQFILLGESTIPGSQAVGEANVAVANANAAGCNAVSVGGYGLGGMTEGGGGGTLIGVPVLVECPQGVKLLPNGARAP